MPPIFVINLERDVERRRHMTETLGALGLAAEFVAAVNGRALPAACRAAYDPAKALRVYGVPMWDNEIACYFSHYGIWQRMVAEGIEVALVLEDDVHVEPALPGVVGDVLASAWRDWMVIRLDTKRGRVLEPRTAKFRGREVAALPGGGAVYRLGTHVLGTGGYLIRREGAARMIDYGRRVFMPVDHTMDRFWENGIRPYVVRPFPVLQKQQFGSSTGVSPPERRHGQPAGVVLSRRVTRVVDGVRKRVYLALNGG